MDWSEAVYNFSNCLGNTAQMRLQKVKNARQGGYAPNTQAGFELLIKHYIKELCLDENVKGTLKQSIEKGEWIKPEDVKIAKYNLQVQQLFSWMDQVLGYQNDNLSEQEKHWLYVTTFPVSWATNFDVQKDIDNTSFNKIDNYMRKQKDGADKKKRQKEKAKKKETDKKYPHKKNKGNNGKYKLDPTATFGPKARCTKCPDAKHSCGNRFLNPWNPRTNWMTQTSWKIGTETLIRTELTVDSSVATNSKGKPFMDTDNLFHRHCLRRLLCLKVTAIKDP